MIAQEVAVAADSAQIIEVAQEVFAALVDDGERSVQERGPALLTPDDVCAWVDMTRPGESMGVRTLVRMNEDGAQLLVRAVLRMEVSEQVRSEDLVDAFGEMANVVGGNLKSLLPDHAALSLPSVSVAEALVGGEQSLADVTLEWRGGALSISLSEVPVGQR